MHVLRPGGPSKRIRDAPGYTSSNVAISFNLPKMAPYQRVLELQFEGFPGQALVFRHVYLVQMLPGCRTPFILPGDQFPTVVAECDYCPV